MVGSAADLKLSGEQFLQTIAKRVAPIGAARLGVLLQNLRESRGLSLRDVALLPELRSELTDIEAGRIYPDAAVTSALLHCYGADLDELVTPHETLVVASGTDDEVLTRYLATIHRWPGSANHPQRFVG